MQITASQLQSQHKALIDALKRGESVEITYHGEILGIVHPKTTSLQLPSSNRDADVFFGMHSDQTTSAQSIEDEIRQLRKGRRQRLDDI
ncbi:hypothetical protein [Spartinivicinus poritis]|uniref:Antitoxin n=1 Tax=Spartinivicinus poritis TaxID=2994640 RepID=A0ABT5ULE1_9GAMM|nr:hypothetical protein [Spartinivicinus sp. A2-2]MDE1465854.1 hypothetical protein [Spartinivicinus sp. A2-2]